MWIFALVLGCYSVAVTIGVIIFWVCYLTNAKRQVSNWNITAIVLQRHNMRALHHGQMFPYKKYLWTLSADQNLKAFEPWHDRFLACFLQWKIILLRFPLLTGFMSYRSSGGKMIPSLIISTPIPKQPAATKGGLTYQSCITYMPQIDFGSTTLQFNTAHSSALWAGLLHSN